MVFLLFDNLDLEYIFIENRNKVHAGSTRLLRLEYGVHSFN
jgi:hypothetical protein